MVEGAGPGGAGNRDRKPPCTKLLQEAGCVFQAQAVLRVSSYSYASSGVTQEESPTSSKPL